MYGYFHTAEAKLRICDRDHMACKAKNIYYIAIYRKCLPTTNLNDIKSKRLDGRNFGKFCFACIQLPRCLGGMWEPGVRAIHSLACCEPHLWTLRKEQHEKRMMN
jgi:hypothetical protein